MSDKHVHSFVPSDFSSAQVPPDKCLLYLNTLKVPRVRSGSDCQNGVLRFVQRHMAVRTAAHGRSPNGRRGSYNL